MKFVDSIRVEYHTLGLRVTCLKSKIVKHFGLSSTLSREKGTEKTVPYLHVGTEVLAIW